MFYIVLLCSFLTVASEPSKRCGLPSKFWCSSREVARRCDVEKQCEPFLSAVTTKAKAAPLVNFTLYMESMCPYCKKIIISQLYPTFKAVGSIMNLAVVPYGNANEQYVDNKWQFTCQHGEGECYGNLLETCAIHFHQNTSVYFPFVHCIEASSSIPRQSAPSCAQQFGLDYSQIKNCADGPLGNALEHNMALKTNALQPTHAYVPWVTLNGVHTKKIQSDADLHLERLICETYQGSPKPEACATKPRKIRLIDILN